MVGVLFWLSWAIASTGQFIMQRHQLDVGQSMIVELRVSGINLSSPPILPVGPGLDAEFQGTSSNTQVSITNGRQQVIKQQVFRYLISGVKEGEWYIGPLRLGRGAQTTSVKSERIFVFPQSEEQQKKASVKAHLDQEKIYEGELVGYHFTYQRRIQNISTDWRPPALTGFAQLDGLEVHQENYAIYEDGESIHIDEIVIPLKAEKAGAYRISPAKVVATIPDGRRRSNRGIFSFFGNSGTQRSYMTAPFTGVILKPPQAPDDFSGLVGELELRQVPDRRQVRLGEAVLLELELKGRGDLRSYRFPPLEAEHLRIYDEPLSRGLSWKEGEIEASLKQQRSIVPLKEGVVEIAPLQLTVFDPKEERYIQLLTEPIRIEVLPGASTGLDLEVFATEQADPELVLASAPENPQGSFVPLWLWSFPPLIPLVALWQKRRKMEAGPEEQPLLDPDASAAEKALVLMQQIERQSCTAHQWSSFDLQLLENLEPERARFYVELQEVRYGGRLWEEVVVQPEIKEA